MHCPTGWPSGTYCYDESSDFEVFEEFIKGVTWDCETGDFVVGNFTTDFSATYYHDYEDENEAIQCQDCPINLFCGDD